MFKHLLKPPLILLLITWLTSCGIEAFAQTGVTITGRVTDAKTNEGLAGVNIHVKGRVIGTTSDNRGTYSLTTTTEIPFTLVFSYVGFQTQEFSISSNRSDLNVVMSEVSALGQEVVVTASRVEENILRAPISIEKMDILAIRETPAANFYEGLQNLKSVDMITSSMGFRIINTRGFNSTTNPRFVQFIDGMDNQSPGLNIPIGNMVGLSDLDAHSVEIVPGAASALYGPNAFNGVLSMTSKSPFEFQGLSAMGRIGVNHINSPNADASPMYEGMIRYAKAFRNRFAFKVNFSYSKALDWHASSTENVDPFTRATLGNDRSNPAYNGLNLYGDEAVTGLPIGPGGASVRVARTPYEEKYLVDYNTFNIKGDAALHYRITEGLEAIYQYRGGKGTAVYQGANRYGIKDFILQQHKVELRGANYFLRSYATLEDAGNSYDSRFLALNLNRTWKPDQQWFTEYAGAYLGGVPGVTPSNHDAARAFADRNRLLPGTPEFEKEKNRIAGEPDFRTGAQFIDATRMYHTEGQYDFSKWTNKIADVQVGGSYRLFDLNSEGTIFSDTTGNDITIYEYGAYVQAIKNLMSDRLKITTSLRFDKNENFEGRLTPRASAVFTLAENHHLRASFQTGFRNPTTQDQFIFLNVGQAILVGGVPSNSQGLNLYGNNSNAVSLSSVQAFAAQVGADVAGGTNSSRAVIQRAGLLRPANVNYVKPEQIKAFEIGYKGLTLNKSLLFDLNYYYSSYNNFILNYAVIQPRNSQVVRNETNTGNEAVAFDVATNNFQPYQLYSNATQKVAAQGASLGLTYSLPRGYTLSGNTNWNKLNLGENHDPDQVPGFNTPEWKFNVTLANRNFYKNAGFSVAYRWSDSYIWQSSFIPGINNAEIPAYGTLDAQVSYKVPSLKSIFKLGGSNITNNYYRTVYGGPYVGGVYYLSITFDELLK
ncbi:membrane protein [Adhaeribacter aerolatus]|uniref:Membrane protein n=1 Tax=Adhaeribacter aerolatus TaxID=670289 RepID=A0A512ASX5_9BACT|nr:TonB-dependent receptor [Adhaeribacter aerolatus]GEO02790.1 membrane protein [Adhaeribacter aerolatus]